MYFPVASVGYFVYGTNIKDNILETVSAGPMLTIVQVLITGHLVCSFIIVINPVCQEIEELLGIERRKIRVSRGWGVHEVGEVVSLKTIYVYYTLITRMRQSRRLKTIVSSRNP